MVVETSYAELRERANDYAKLVSDSPEKFVAVSTSLGPETIAAYLGAWWAGKAYVPIDLSWPAARLKHVFADTDVRLLIAERPDDSADLPDGLNIIDPSTVSRNFGTAMAPPEEFTSTAFVVYTSGSTGLPKGTLIPHQAILARLIEATFAQVDEQTVWLQHSPQTFDAVTLEVWAPLLNGGCSVLYPDSGLPELHKLKQVIETTGVNILWLTASFFNHVIDHLPGALTGVPCVMTGGESVSVQHVVKANRLLPETQLINGYGPTENATFTTVFPIPKDFPAEATCVPIGAPISHTRIWILDEEDQEVSAGEVGELVAGGLGLAEGYLNLPELSAQRFLVVPVAGERVYRTGDLVRRREDGLIEFVGRTDDQIKLNGHRIELGEIEVIGRAQPGIRDFRVLLQEGREGSKKLVGYFIGDISEAESRRWLSEHLPRPMVPSFLEKVDSIPLNAHGKIDRHKLPNPLQTRSEPADEADIPAHSVGQRVAAAWRRAVPDLAEFEWSDNFFDVGASSMDVLSLAQELEKAFGRVFEPVEVMTYPTVESLAEHIENADAPADEMAAHKSRADARKRAQRSKRRRRVGA